MKLRYLGIFSTGAILSLCIVAHPVFTHETAATGNTEASLATGTAVYADLNSGLDSKKVKAGDAVTAHVSETVRSADGRAILPKGTKIVGHVVQASARAKGGNESMLGIAFDKAILKDGQEVSLNLAIQALAAPVSFSAASDMEAPSPSGSGTPQNSPMGGRSGPPLQSAPQTSAGPSGPPTQGGDSSASLGPNSRGVYGLNGLKLGNSAGNGKAPVSIVTSEGKNVKLDPGTRMLLVEQAVASEAPGR